MHIENFRSFCLGLHDFVTEDFPFDKKTLVFKIHGKMFALLDVDNFSSINLKCDPERAIDLRERFDSIEAGYHMSKKHWNTVKINSDVSDEMLFELTKHSFDLVFSSLPKKIQSISE